MRSARLASFVWPGMVLAGLALAVAVWAAWPEPTTRIVRLPYGEALPKQPLAAEPATRTAAPAPAPAPVVAPAPVLEPAPALVAPAEPAPVPEVEEEARVLAVVEPEEEPAREAAAPVPAQGTWGPDPVPSVVDGLAWYRPEPPESLGAAPLPGFEATPAPPAAG